MTRHLMVIICLCMIHLNSFATTNKILIISSYGTDYQWSNNVMDGIEDNISKTHPSIEFVREFLSSEALQDAEEWGSKVTVLLSNYKRNPPKAIVLVSDEAWMAYRQANIAAFKDVPIILCAVKPHSISVSDFMDKRDSLQLSDFTLTTTAMKEYNATAVFRKMNVPGYLSLMDNLINNLDRFVFITDKRFYGIYTRLLLKEEAEKRYPNIAVEYIDGRFVGTDSLLARLPQIPTTAGVLLTSWLTGEYGFEYSKDFLYSQMETMLNTPIFITNNIGFEKEYFIGGYFNSGAFWGEKTASLILPILAGKDPHHVTPEFYHDEECNIAWKVFNHYNVNRLRLPAKVQFYNAPESFWVAYKKYIAAVGSVFLIFLLFYSYTLRSNVKLHNTQRLLLKSIDEANAGNAKLEKTQAELMIALHKAEESDRLKSAFLANMSHEIRTPLNAIVGFSSILDEIESEEERSEYVVLIKRNSDLLLQLLSDILDLSKIEAGVLDFKFSQTDALTISSDLISSLSNKCKPGVKLQLGKEMKPMKLHTDHNRLSQVLINLTNNAIKFTPQGTIEIGYSAHNDEWVEFYVKDTGMGIAKDQLNTIFDRFTKLNAYIEGTGLGLSICQTIIETLGGEIGVESEEGVGTRFWFRIKKEQTTL